MQTCNTTQWRERGEMLILNGRHLFTIDEGDSSQPTLLLIHGFPTASWDWSFIWDSLRQHYRLLALDLLGFGFSDKPAGHPYSIIEQADFVEALVKHKQLQHFHVLAHDYGDTVAQELLARQNCGAGRGRWLSLCLLNGGLFPETHHAVLAQKLLLSPVGAIVSRLFTKNKMAGNLRQVFGPETPPGQQDIDGFWELIQHNSGQRNFHRLIRYMPERIRHRTRWVTALQQAAIPIGLVNGSMDPVSGDHMIARYLEVVGTPAYLARLPRIGHYPQIEDPNAVSEHVLAFLLQSEMLT